MKPSPTTAKPLQHFLVLLPGILVCLLIAYSARYAGTRLPVIGGAVFGILFGMVAGRVRRPESCAPGIRFTGRKVLQYSIVLLGFDMNVIRILTVGGQSLSVILLVLSAAFFTAFSCQSCCTFRAMPGY
jgi:uncharacterized membrane protein YadS